METIQEKIIGLFERIRDPRRVGRIHYSIKDILFIALCTYLTGGESFYDMEDFARIRLPWPKELIGLKKIPSHDTFNRIFQILSPTDFQELLIDLANEIRADTGGDVIAIDGKTHRGTGGTFVKALHTLNVWSTKNHIALAQMLVDSKSNEIKAMPEILERLKIDGCIITADALNCQREIATKVIKKKADYIFPVKGNQRRLQENLIHYFNKFAFENEPFTKTLEKSHGRIEERLCWQSEELAWVEESEKWLGLKSIGMVKTSLKNMVTGDESTCQRYYISSLPLNSERFLECSRKHWEVENCLHWTLDVVFKEDEEPSERT